MSDAIAQHDARWDAARGVIQSGVDARAFPAAAIEVGRTRAPVWREGFGRLRYDTDAPLVTPSTIFDLASLTKVIATASIAMRQIGAGALQLDTRIAGIIPEWRGADRAGVTMRHLLDHSSGLPAHVRFFERIAGRDAFLRAIAELPLERAPGSQSVYSDPGFILLGLALEKIGGAPLDDQFAPVAAPLGGVMTYRPPLALHDRIAPTEHDPWRGRLLQGEVHDENAAALGGVAAHAGLFGTVNAAGAFARLVLATFQSDTVLGSPALMTTFATKTGVPGSSRALAWDTMLPTSSCGTHLSPRAIGHTGFTGTSLWIDPALDLYVVFLTNRVHTTRANDAHIAIRPRVHDAIATVLERIHT